MAHRITVGPHQISFTLQGGGGPAVVIEPAFGGTAEQWADIAGKLAAQTTALTYDRAAYGESSRAMDHRGPAEIARDLHGVLDAVGVARPLVLVGHSYGGVCIRKFTEFYDGEVAGMVLVDSSYEGQRAVMRGSWPLRVMLSAVTTVPLLMFLRQESRNYADRRSLVREYRSLLSLKAGDRALSAGALGSRPLATLTRGPGDVPNLQESWRRWNGMQEELAQLSSNSRHIISREPNHYVHMSEPDLVTTTILDVVHSARTGSSLTGRTEEAS